ncbi:MAG: hypothetical protein AAF694_01470 [Bacteroidota bacterium]
MRDKNRSSRKGPGREELQAFIEGKLASDREEDLRAYMEEDPLAKDALEGLMWTEEPKEVAKRLKRIKQHSQKRLLGIRETTQQLSKRNSRVKPEFAFNPFIASLAGLAFIVIAWGLIVFTSRNNAMVDNSMAVSELRTETEPLQLPEDRALNPGYSIPYADSVEEKSESEFLAENSSNTRQRGAATREFSNRKRGKKKFTSSDSRVYSAGGASFNTSLISFEGSLPEESLPEDEVSFILTSSDPIPLSSQVIFLSANQDHQKLSELESSKIPAIPKQQIKKSRMRMAANEAKPSGQVSLNQPESYIRGNALPNNPRSFNTFPKMMNEKLSQLHLGIWYFTYDMYDEAEEKLVNLELDDALDLNENLWASSATTWYLSRIYLSTGRERKAKRLLEKISEFENPYQIEAKSLLQKL